MKQLFSFKGRMGRSKFALTFLSAFLLLVLTYVLEGLLLPITEPSSEHTAATLSLELFVTGILVVLIWCSVWILSASWAKRLHDIGVSGWYQLILLVPFLNYLMMVVLFLPGTSAGNKYGEKS
jgi:uncharacterized membrane protein YhaH (DUF805 family)